MTLDESFNFGNCKSFEELNVAFVYKETSPYRSMETIRKSVSNDP